MTARTLAQRLPLELSTRIVIERILLAFAIGFVVVNASALAILRGSGVLDWLPVILWTVCCIVGHQLLNRWLPTRDGVLFPVVMLLSGWGLVTIDRLAPIFADRQAIWLVVGLIGMLFAACRPELLRMLRAFRYSILLGGLFLLITSILFGVNPSDPNGVSGAPQLWLGFGGLYFQPSEVLKLALVAFLASYLAEQYPLLSARDVQRSLGGRVWTPRLLGPVLLMWGICVVMLVWQRDLGTALIFFIVFLTLIYLASGQIWVMLAGGVLIIAAGIFAYSAFGVVQQRVDIWINPWPEAENRAYHIVQSLLAFSSGGVFGQGIGQGSPGYVPVVHSDSVFAAIGEEWGLLGAATVIVLVAVIAQRGLQAALAHQERPYYALLGAGMTTLLTVQSLIIIGGVLKVIPLTGVTLPFVSYGGSSLVVSFVMIGLLLRLSSSESSHAI